MAIFDPSTFMSMTFEEANSTSVTPPPVGEYLATADKAEVTKWSSNKDGDVKEGLKFTVQWAIDDEGVKALLERDKVLVRQEMFLDLNEQGGLDMGKGKNVQLGRLREALGLNTVGQPFAFPMVEGRQAKVAIRHDPDKNDASIIYARVNGVAPAA